MANTIIESSGVLYRYSIEATIVLNNGEEILEIDNLNIDYLFIEYDYINKNMPTMIMSLNLDRNILDKMYLYANNSVINLLVHKYIAETTDDVKTVYIQDQFSYFMTESTNPYKELDYLGPNDERTDINSNITLGLLKVDHINNIQRNFNGVLKNTTLMDSIFYFCNGMQILIEPFQYNPLIQQLPLININSVSKAIKYLNDNYQAFYDSPYRFFMDFSNTYLLSSSGNAVPKKGDVINSVMFNSKQVNNATALMQGVTINNEEQVYIIDLLYGTNINILEDKSIDKKLSGISVVDVVGTEQSGTANITKNANITPKSTPLRIYNNNTVLLKNKISFIEMGAIVLDINKMDLDTSLITMNNKYSLKTDSVDTVDRNGDYILNYKSELFVRKDTGFQLDMRLKLNKKPL